jgi:hypothetical protein
VNKQRFSGKMAQIYMAQQINKSIGMGIAPWDLPSLSEEWFVALDTWVFGMPEAAKRKQQADDALEALRARMRKERMQ